MGRKIVKGLIGVWCIISGICLVWGIISWLNIIGNNLDPNPGYQGWNLFVILLRR